jgi:hypothetical protein
VISSTSPSEWNDTYDFALRLQRKVFIIIMNNKPWVLLYEQVNIINAKDGKSIVIVIVSFGMFFLRDYERFQLNFVFGDYTKS